MTPILTSTAHPLAAIPRDLLKKLIDSAGYPILREVIASKAAHRAVEAANWAIAGDSEQANAISAVAARYVACVEILDELQKSEDQWSTVKIEPRR